MAFLDAENIKTLKSEIRTFTSKIENLDSKLECNYLKLHRLQSKMDSIKAPYAPLDELKFEKSKMRESIYALEERLENMLETDPMFHKLTSNVSELEEKIQRQKKQTSNIKWILLETQETHDILDHKTDDLEANRAICMRRRNRRYIRMGQNPLEFDGMEDDGSSSEMEDDEIDSDEWDD